MFNKIYRLVIEGRVFQNFDEKVYRFIIRAEAFLHNHFQKFWRLFDRAIRYFPRKLLSRSTAIDPQMIMLITYQGTYTCNPKAVAAELIRQKVPYKLYWVVKETPEEGTFPPELNLVKRGSFEFYEAAAKAKVFVDNTHDLPRLGIRKKKGQFIFQTWHGSLGIKRLDGNVVMNKKWKILAKRCREETDYCITNSTFEEEVFRTSYWEGVPTLQYGHARNDILFSDQSIKDKIRKKVCQELEIPEGKKILLYAPTHKDNVDEHLFELDYTAINEALEDKFGGEWIIAIRLHSRMQKKASKWIKENPGKVINATAYQDMQEVMIAADIGVTDYSSWIFDYILLKRPGFILADDLEEFEKSRDFYYPLNETPFPISTNNETFIEQIKMFEEEKYQKAVAKFLEARGCMEDGHASERIVGKIRELMGD